MVIITSPIAVSRDLDLDLSPSSPPPAFTPSYTHCLDATAAGATDAATSPAAAAAAAATAKLQGQEHSSAAPAGYRKAGCYGDGDGDGGSTRARRTSNGKAGVAGMFAGVLARMNRRPSSGSAPSPGSAAAASAVAATLQASQRNGRPLTGLFKRGGGQRGACGVEAEQ